MSSPSLSLSQVHALFDILTHHEVYSEIEAWKWPDPIRNEENRQSSSPLIRRMFKTFVLTLPGINELPSDFWKIRAGTMLANLSEAELSESYDKGSMGMRKTLSTACAVMIESAARGYLGGCPGIRKEDIEDESKYDQAKAEDLKKAWDQVVHQIVYGDLIDELFDAFAKSEKLEDLSPMVQAALKHILLMGASFLHHIFFLSPSGQNILKLTSNAHKLVPYMAVKQALRVGNAATMINGVLRLILTKLSMTAITNWMGLSKNSDDGLNLLQQIMSTVLNWDNPELQDVTSKIKKDKNGPSKEHLDAIETHIDSASREHHENLRTISIKQSKSIVNVIFEIATYPLSSPLSPAQHAQALEYYSARLSIRDRKEIIRVLCRQYPDNLTQSIREVVAVFEPLIRSVHNGVDLSLAVGYLQDFSDDLIKTVKPKSGNGNGNGNEAPSVEDIVDLYRRHIPSVFRFLHDVCSNCPEWVGTWRKWCKEAVLNFRRENESDWQETGAAGSMTESLNAQFSSLPDEQKPEVLAALEKHATYLATLDKISMQRAQSILDNDSQTMYGPGVYLARWHGLLDETLITPAKAEGPVRRGKDVQFKDKAEGEEAKKKDNKAEAKWWWDSAAIAKEVMADMPEQPNVEVVLKALGGSFREFLSKAQSNDPSG